jgi:hypothetical protein
MVIHAQVHSGPPGSAHAARNGNASISRSRQKRSPGDGLLINTGALRAGIRAVSAECRVNERHAVSNEVVNGLCLLLATIYETSRRRGLGRFCACMGSQA